MVTFKEIKSAQDTVLDHWGEQGEEVIEICFVQKPFEGNFNDFLNHCTACGGNWGGMLLSGVKELYPDVWEAIPEEMGEFAFADICATLHLLNIFADKK